MASLGQTKGAPSAALSQLQRSAEKPLSSRGVGQLNVLGKKKSPSVVKQKVVAPRPLNTPSLRLEHSGNNPLTNLVPTGASSWQDTRGEDNRQKERVAPAPISYGNALTGSAENERRKSEEEHDYPGLHASRNHGESGHYRHAEPQHREYNGRRHGDSHYGGYGFRDESRAEESRNASTNGAYRPPMLRVDGREPDRGRHGTWGERAAERRYEDEGGYGGYGGMSYGYDSVERNGGGKGIAPDSREEVHGWDHDSPAGYGTAMTYGSGSEEKGGDNYYGGYGGYGGSGGGYGEESGEEEGGVYGRLEDPHEEREQARLRAMEAEQQREREERREREREHQEELARAQREMPSEEEKEQEALRKHERDMDKLRHAAPGSFAILRRPQPAEKKIAEPVVPKQSEVPARETPPFPIAGRPAWATDEHEQLSTPEVTRTRGVSEDEEDTPSSHYEGFVATLTAEDEESKPVAAAAGPVAESPKSGATAAVWEAGNSSSAGGFLNGFSTLANMPPLGGDSVFGNMGEVFKNEKHGSAEKDKHSKAWKDKKQKVAWDQKMGEGAAKSLHKTLAGLAVGESPMSAPSKEPAQDKEADTKGGKPKPRKGRTPNKSPAGKSEGGSSQQQAPVEKDRSEKRGDKKRKEKKGRERAEDAPEESAPTRVNSGGKREGPRRGQDKRERETREEKVQPADQKKPVREERKAEATVAIKKAPVEEGDRRGRKGDRIERPSSRKETADVDAGDEAKDMRGSGRRGRGRGRGAAPARDVEDAGAERKAPPHEAVPSRGRGNSRGGARGGSRGGRGGRGGGRGSPASAPSPHHHRKVVVTTKDGGGVQVTLSRD
mmetsp:Transcript_8595/g.23067  ORF Transcript_8595/g.23067 Transcript_8595/m.23067 type:complete len:836 (-) Transcript_8595:576-3083(-)